MSRTSARRRILIPLVFSLLALVAAPALFAHCQIPCGIYGDETRFDIMLEDVTTIEKSMKQIQELGAQAKPDWNQLVRWVNNKEEHAQKLTDVVTFYFLAQRIKPVEGDDKAAQQKYVHELTLLHHIMVHAMKAKQTTDVEHVKTLRELIGSFKASYMGEHGHSH